MRSLIALILALTLGACPVLCRTFVHPGAIDSMEELEFVRARIQEGAQPWKGEFERLRQMGQATRSPHALVRLHSKGQDAWKAQDDAISAYAQALLWFYSGDENYARGSVAILNAWADLEAFIGGTDQDRLLAGWMGAALAPAAEIMRLYPKWTAGEKEKLQAMFRRAFYPQLKTASTWNGNVDLTQIDALISIAVFNEDEAEFEEALARLGNRSRAYFYLQSDGPLPHPIKGDGGDLSKFWFHPTRWVDGLTQETCRDNGHHAQYGMGSALHAAEVAWHQRVDVYTEHQARYVAAMELLATQFLTGSMQGVCEKDTPSRSRQNTWEIGFSHYAARKGLELPMTRRLIREQIRPHAERASCNLILETLTHGELPGELGRCTKPSASLGK
jgi:hypothetical protein